MTLDMLSKRRGNPTRLIENRVAIAGNNSQLSIYDTYQAAASVPLASDHLLYCGMITGKKIMHGQGVAPCDFLPNESFVIAPGRQVLIDFPEAAPDTPTTCMAIEIQREQIDRICSKLSGQALHDMHDRGYQPDTEQTLHVPHSAQTQALLERLFTFFREDDPDRDTLVDLALDELVVRMLRTRTRELLLDDTLSETHAGHGLAAALHWIRDHLASPLDSSELARRACMSRAQLYRQFKRELGVTPRQFQQKLRMEKARDWLRHDAMAVTRIAYDLGYRSPSYFCRLFKTETGVSPSAYRSRPVLPPERLS